MNIKDNEKLEEAHRQYCDTINRMDVNAEEMDKKYGQMVLERDRLQAENKELQAKIVKLQSFILVDDIEETKE